MTEYSRVQIVVLMALRDPASDIEEAVRRTSLEANTFCDAFDVLAARGLIKTIDGSSVSLTEHGKQILKGHSN